MSKYNYIFDDEESIYQFAGEVIQISRIANRLGIEIEEYIDDMKNGGYLNPETLPTNDEEYTLKALAVLMEAAIEKYLVRVVGY